MSWTSQWTTFRGGLDQMWAHFLHLSSGLHPSEEHLKANHVTTPHKGSSRCSFFPSFWRIDRYDPSWPHISQDSLLARKRIKTERKWRHRVAKIVTFSGLGGRNHDVRVKHLVTQPGNAPKARPSHLTTADQVNEVSLKDSPSKTAKTELRHSNCFGGVDTCVLRHAEGPPA